MAIFTRLEMIAVRKFLRSGGYLCKVIWSDVGWKPTQFLRTKHTHRVSYDLIASDPIEQEVLVLAKIRETIGEREEYLNGILRMRARSWLPPVELPKIETDPVKRMFSLLGAGR